MKVYRRRDVVKAGGVLAATAVLPSAGQAQVGQAQVGQPQVAKAQQRAVLNDASGLNSTQVFRHWVVGAKEEAEFASRLRAELATAKAEKRPVAAGAARHSMGGQSLPRDGLAISLNTPRCETDTAAKTFRVGPGTRWNRVIATLDAAGFSPAVMQSNNDFGVASTFSVNAHGWPVPYGPFGTTVRAIKLMLADGSVVECSRTQNAELFGLAMGGYGLFGIILELECEMVTNTLLKPTYSVKPAKDFASRFITACEADKSVTMAYGRLSLDKARFFTESLLVTYQQIPSRPKGGLPKASNGGLLSSLTRQVYRAQVGSDAAKRARWLAETVVSPKASSGIATRNTLMNEPVSNLANRDRKRTDILHEYFIPPERFADFIEACRRIIPSSKLEFLNVTLRYVGADPTSVLAFAPKPRIAAVMSFSQELTSEAEVEMRRVTEALIEAMVGIGGTFYLPYRLHARRDQVAKAYPNVARFAERKRHYDPDLLFQNAMWQTYLAA